MTSELKIRTPEGVVFTYWLAGPVARCLAWVVDLAITLVLMIAVNMIASRLGIVVPDFAGALFIVSGFVIWICYGIILEAAWRGQTVGKRALRLRVMDAHGFQLQFHQVLLRNLLRAVDCLPLLYLVGGIVSLVSPRGQRLGDLVAGTVVVYHRRQREPDLEQLLGSKHNSIREQATLVARLRQRITPEEARIALEALVRREDLEPARRLELFRELAAYFAQKVEFPPEIRESLPDEQFVRNVVDVLFRAGPGSCLESPARSSPGAQPAVKW
jgi:uncharacterized RDD family membrane protein YckC